MKDITTKISESVTHIESESSGKAFKEQVKYSKSDWEKWKKETKEDVMVGNYDAEPEIELVYIPNHKERTMQHIGTYNKKKQILYCDDIKLFGHEE